MMEAPPPAWKAEALYVVRANPLKTFEVKQPERPRGLALRFVHLCFPRKPRSAPTCAAAASSHTKRRTLTNTAGEFQMIASLDRSARAARSDFDLIPFSRISSSCSASARRFVCDAGIRHSTKSRQKRARYESSGRRPMLRRRRQLSTATVNPSSRLTKLRPAWFSPQRLSCFPDGTLGLTVQLKSTRRAKDTPWSSSPNIHSWWIASRSPSFVAW